MPDFWRNSGFHLLERDASGRLRVTDDYLRAYYLRPEVHPVEESGPREHELHASLMADPRRRITQAEIDAVEAEDIAELARVLLPTELLSASGIGPDEERFTAAVERVNPGLVTAAAA